MTPNNPKETPLTDLEQFPSLNALDASVTPQVEVDGSIDLIKRAQVKGDLINFDFDEDEFTCAYPDWKNK